MLDKKQKQVSLPRKTQNKIGVNNSNATDGMLYIYIYNVLHT